VVRVSFRRRVRVKIRRSGQASASGGAPAQVLGVLLLREGRVLLLHNLVHEAEQVGAVPRLVRVTVRVRVRQAE